MDNKFTDGILLLSKGEIKTVMRAFNAYYLKDGKKIWVTVPKGFESDLASTPRPLLMILPRTGSHDGAAIVHDYVYSIGKFNRKDCDLFFWQLLRAAKISNVISRLAYLAVRIGGKKRYLKDLTYNP